MMTLTKQRSRVSRWKGDAVKVLLALVFITAVFLPMIRMFLHMDGESIQKVFGGLNFGRVVTNSLVSALLGTVLTVTLAVLMAFCSHRTGIRRKGLFEVIFVLPMLIPSISCGMGLVILLGNNGLLTRLLGMNASIYGLTGIVLGSFLYAFPVAYLMVADVLRYEDGAAYEAARVLGIPKWRQFTSITLPYLRKPLISVVFAVFTLIITDYGVPLMVGGKYKTVAAVMYEEVIGGLDFGKGAVYGSLLLIPAVIAFIIDLMNKDGGKLGFVTTPCGQSQSRLTKAAAYGGCGAVCGVLLLPLVAFALLAFATDYPGDLTFTAENLMNTFARNADQYLINSLIIALGAATAGTALAFGTAYLSARMKSGGSRFLHLCAMTSAAIPGIALGLGYVLTFSGTALSGTIVILMAVNIVHFISSPYLMMYNSLNKINGNLEDVASTMGVGRLYMIRDVFLPQCKGTLLEMFSYLFVNSMITISAVSFLADTANRPISLMINQFEAQMQIECAAVVSLLILGCNLLVKGAVALLRRKKK